MSHSQYRYDVIPIVYGSADYEHIAPYKSFINIMDFDSVEKLAFTWTEMTQHTMNISSRWILTLHKSKLGLKQDRI